MYHCRPEISQPVLVYYKIDNFYQNHNRYRDSRDDGQVIIMYAFFRFLLLCCLLLVKVNIPLPPLFNRT